MNVLGIDIGGTAIKGAPVDTASGKLLEERLRFKTPKKSTPANVRQVVHEIIQHFNWQGAVGAGFPGVIKNGRVYTAANLHKSWIGMQADEFLAENSACTFNVMNDADAAGCCEIHFGDNRNRTGVAILVTLGTGIGTALFKDGKLLPNAELGHIEINGKDAELHASERIRFKKKLSLKQWGKNVARYLQTLENLLAPDVIIIGGGGSEHFKKISKYFDGLNAHIAPAQFGNEAGILGAAAGRCFEFKN